MKPSPYINNFYPQNGEVLGIMVFETIIPSTMILDENWRGSATMNRKNIELFRGDTRTVKAIIRDEDMNVIDLTGCRVVMTIKDYKSSSTAVIVKDTSVEGDGDINEPDLGDSRIYLTTEETSLLTSSQYYYCIAVFTESNRRFTVAEGTVLVSDSGMAPEASFSNSASV